MRVEKETRMVAGAEREGIKDGGNRCDWNIKSDWIGLISRSILHWSDKMERMGNARLIKRELWKGKEDLADRE